MNKNVVLYNYNMKKIYQEEKYIHFNNHRTIKAMKQRTKIKKRKHSLETVSGKVRSRKINTIKAPVVFSIVYNSDFTIKFFKEILFLIKKGKPIFVNLSAVTIITPDAILYLIVLVQEAKYKKVSFRGNAPLDKNARNIFTKSGFYDFVKSDLNKFQLPPDSSILKIKTGKDVNGNEAESIQKYLQSHVHNINKAKLKAIYSILIECMSNTNEYAGHDIGTKHWWTMALHNKETDKVLFAFVDNGVGIPKTVKTKWFDSSSDSELLKKAASGVYQMSGSKEKSRNKGLPQIRKYNEDGFIQNLVIISNNGYYSVKDDTKELSDFFTGTMIAWEFT